MLGLSRCDRGLLWKVAWCLNLALSVCGVQSGGGSSFLLKARLEKPSEVMHVEKAISHPQRMCCQAEGVAVSNGLRELYIDKAYSDNHTMATTLVFFFPRGLRRRWTFLLLEFPDDSNQLVKSLVYIHSYFG